MIYIELFEAFLKVGLFSFGGGYASIPLIRDVVMSYGWLSEDMLTYMIAVSESTPGPIMVNLATYVGITQAGMPGAFVATFAVVLPAFFIIIAIVAFLSRVIENPYVAAVMQGLKSCVTGIILATGVHMVIRNCMISKAMAESGAPAAGAGSAFPVDIRAAIVTILLAGIYYGSRKLKRSDGKRKGLTPIQLIGISAVLGMIVYR
jgi:chromate transporter